jgi:lysophospholipase L1-like esterase
VRRLFFRTILYSNPVMLGELARFLVALWHVAGLLLIFLLVTEFGVEGWRRLNRWLRYRRATHPDRAALADAYGGAAWSAAYFAEFRRAVRVDWKPYVEWWQRPFRGIYVTLDERGLRPTPGEESAGAEAIRILCFGGSTMMGMGARDDHTVPAVLARRLAELGHCVAVTNYGQLGHNSTQEVITLQQLLKSGERIDVALFYDGINEMACAEQTGRADRLFNEARRRAEFNLLHPERRRELITAGLMFAAPRTLRRLRQLTGLPLRGPLPEPETDLSRVDIANLAREVLAAYAANLRLIRLLASGYGFHPLFFWQPVITTKKFTTGDERRWIDDYTRDPGRRVLLYDAIIRERRCHPELVNAADAIDLSALFDDCKNPVYIDLYHLSEAGNSAVAEAMLPTLVAAIGRLRRGAQSAAGGI